MNAVVCRRVFCRVVKKNRTIDTLCVYFYHIIPVYVCISLHLRRVRQNAIVKLYRKLFYILEHYLSSCAIVLYMSYIIKRVINTLIYMIEDFA